MDLNLITNEEIILSEAKSVTKGLIIFAYESIILAEIFGNGVLYNNESFLLSEAVSLSLEVDFANYLRGIPLSDIQMTNIARVDLGGGYAQFLDLWGRTKKKFEITIPLSHKTEIKNYQDFHKEYFKKTFFFTSPVDGIKYNVRFFGDNLKVDRVFIDSFNGKIILEETL